jgi:DNA polymerase/3'-5' exonuclease PolX
MTYEKARKLAIEAGERLKPYCEIIKIAGSVRRRKYDIKDIELICIPHKAVLTSSDLFGQSTTQTIISDGYITEVKRLGSILNGQFGGRYMRVKFRDTFIDIFTPQAYDFWRQYVIRTGSAAYIHSYIASAWLKKGWCGTDEGLRRISDCRSELVAGGKRKWYVEKEGELPPVWESEADFYKWLGVDLIDPRQRETFLKP